jgi:predicted Zn finger-like uncharacterized protein
MSSCPKGYVSATGCGQIALPFGTSGVKPVDIGFQKTLAEHRRQATGGKMRLTCPNCGAQYEVPDEVIPESGRDVQCSNCGDTWFQTHPDHPDAVPPFDPEMVEPEWEDTDPEPEPEREQDHGAEPEPHHDENPEAEDDQEKSSDAGPLEQAPHVANRRELDDEVTSVLREEAEREKRARESEASGGLETQPDLGLGEADELERRSQQAKARMARLRGVDEQEDEDFATENPEIDLGTRRNLLPDIEDVDKRIEAEAEGVAEATSARDGSRIATQKESKGRGGFGRGLRLSIVLAVILTALYMFAPNFVEMVPQLEGPLSSYTQIVDQGRAMLQDQLGGVAGTLKGLIGG